MLSVKYLKYTLLSHILIEIFYLFVAVILLFKNEIYFLISLRHIILFYYQTQTLFIDFSAENKKNP